MLRAIGDGCYSTSLHIGGGRVHYRLGIDLGTNSLGWAAVQLKETGSGYAAGQLMDMGVRIFSDARSPKDKSSNAAQRRAPRGARRNRDRKLSRAKATQRVLADVGLWPDDPAARKILEGRDPWVLRARALDERLKLHEIGRALFHLQLRRGFKSNRKTDGGDDGAMFDAIKKARAKMAAQNARTLGELFGRPRLDQVLENKSHKYGARKPMPQARVKSEMTGSKTVYDYYPDRSMILDEFDQIWRSQARFHDTVMTDYAREKVRHVISYQRPLKSQRAGKCTFLEKEPRAPKALPTSHYARVLQEVNNLRVGAVGEADRSLTDEERNTIVQFLMTPSSKTSKRSFKAIRTKLNLPESQRFNLESPKRVDLLGDTTAAAMTQQEAWGKNWLLLPRDKQDLIVVKLIEAEQPDDFIPWLMERFVVDEALAERVFTVRLPEGYGKLSVKALDAIVPGLETGLRFDEAARLAFGDHRATGDGVIYDDGLPYYGEVLSRHTAFEKDNPGNDEEKWGRVANPTVHVALNQVQKVINDLIKRWGKPSQIVLELARDLPLSDRGLKELESYQAKNQETNERRRKQLEDEGIADSFENRFKLRLYEEAIEAFGGVAVCVFSGETINWGRLFSPEIEIEHILPLSRTLDDSFANKVLATRESNRRKGNKAPYEAFGSSPNGFDWELIGERAAKFTPGKQWRFAPDAMEKWEERGGGFLDRQLNDTRYIARLGKTFTEALYGGGGVKGEVRRVWAVPGRLTSDLRHYAGFNTLIGLMGGNRKDRTDHRHHAVDALVVALTDQSMVQRAARLAKQGDRATYDEIMVELAEPLKRYRKSAEDRLGKLTVSHKPDHGFQDAMHNESAYGIADVIDKKKKTRALVTRKPLSSFKTHKDLNSIIDQTIRQHFIQATDGMSGKAFAEVLEQVGGALLPPVRRLRISTPMNETSFVTISHGQNGIHRKAYKGDGNYCYDIFADAKGKWTGKVVTTFEAYQRAQKDEQWWCKTEEADGKKLIMRLRKGDLLEIDSPDGGRKTVVLYKFSSGKLYMAEHFEANASARIRAKELDGYQMAPSSLQKANALRVTVSPSGKVKRY